MHRDDFPKELMDNVIYLDNGATTFKPKVVLDKMNEYYTKYCANAHRGDYSLSYKVDVEYENARIKVAKFINANPDEVVFTSGATESLNLIVKGFFENNLEAGDEVIISDAEHASNVMPWFRLATKYGVVIKRVKLDGNLHVTLENLKETITPKTKVISLAEITNVVGDIRPMKEICKLAHENNIFVVCDGAQSVPHRKCDVKDSDVDFLAFSGHKMCGPTGVGVLYGKKELLEEVEPILLGGGMNESFDNENEVYLKDLPQRLEAGTPNIAGVIGLGAAVDYLEKIGMDTISIYEQKLKSYLISKLEKIPYIQIINEEADSGIVAFNVEDVFSQDVAYYLNKYNICVRAGNHCAKILKYSTGVKNTVRVSLYFYNTKEEIDSLVELLSNKDKIIKEMILDNYSNPFHKETKGEDFETANANNSSCIDNINIFIKFDGNIIKDAYFDGEACAISTASTSIMLKEIIGKTKEEALAIIDNFNNMINEQDYDKDKMNESLAFDEMYKQESRKTCATLPYKALYKLVSK